MERLNMACCLARRLIDNNADCKVRRSECQNALKFY